MCVRHFSLGSVENVCVCVCVCKTFKKFQPPIFKVLKLRVGSGRPVVYLEAINSFWSEVISTYLK